MHDGRGGEQYHFGGGAGGSATPRASKKRKAKKGANLYEMYQERDYHERGDGGGDHFRREVDVYEEAKRSRRAGRFEDTLPGGRAHADSPDRWSNQRINSLDGTGSGDVTLDYTIHGTSQTLEKKYLRLTSAPNPATVRPEPVLRAAIELIRSRYESYGEDRGQEQYIYLWEQMKSVRQDLTVQRIRNDFTVEVYEMHARICLEFADQTEFLACQAQLTQLYEEGLGTAEARREFTAYDILYNVGKEAHNNVSDLMLMLTPEDRQDEHIAHALKVRAAAALGDYTTFFRLYTGAPGHSQHVMDTFADKARLEALRVALKAYMPSVPLTFLSRNLGFDGDEEGAHFIEDHGISYLADDKGLIVLPKLIDCKSSRATLVDYSIEQKIEEERKKAQRKAEIVPITFS